MPKVNCFEEWERARKTNTLFRKEEGTRDTNALVSGWRMRVTTQTHCFDGGRGA